MFNKKVTKNKDLSQFTISQLDEEELSDSIEVLPLGTTEVSKRTALLWTFLFLLLFSLALILSLVILSQGFSRDL